MSENSDLLLSFTAAVLGIPLIYAMHHDLVILQVLLGGMAACLAFLAL